MEPEFEIFLKIILPLIISVPVLWQINTYFKVKHNSLYWSAGVVVSGFLASLVTYAVIAAVAPSISERSIDLGANLLAGVAIYFLYKQHVRLPFVEFWKIWVTYTISMHLVSLLLIVALYKIYGY